MARIDVLHGIHAGEHEPGEVIERAREMLEQERRRERQEADRILNRHGVVRHD